MTYFQKLYFLIWGRVEKNLGKRVNKLRRAKRLVLPLQVRDQNKEKMFHKDRQTDNARDMIERKQGERKTEREI